MAISKIRKKNRTNLAMRFFRKLAIALYHLLFGALARSRSTLRRSSSYAPKVKPNDADEYRVYRKFDHQNVLSRQDDLSTQIIISCGNYLTAQPDLLQTQYYTSPDQSYYPQNLDWQDVEGEYDEDDYLDEDAEDYELDDYGLVEYRFETFGGDTFIEFSYEGDLDEQEIVRVLSWLWTSSPDRLSLDRSYPAHFNNVLAGTLRMPLSPSRLISLPHGRL
jgi:hypothetical protein